MKHFRISATMVLAAVSLFASAATFSCGARNADGARGAGTGEVSPQPAARGGTDDDSTESDGMSADPAVHPSFSVTLADLQAMTENEPAPVRTRILADPERFFELLAPVLDADPELLLLADKRHELPAGYVPDDLVPLERYPDILPNREGLLLRETAIGRAAAMSRAAREDDVRLLFSSTYRSYAYQKNLYERYVADYGQEEADRFSARPGTSQHQLGTVVDFGSISDEFTDTPAAAWLGENAWRFGFSLSYPDGYEEVTGYRFESWHYRYIGHAAALLEREFFGGIQQYLLEFLHMNRAALERARTEG